MSKIDLTNRRFNKLICLSSESDATKKSVIWTCKCDCGKIKKFTASNLLRGHCKSCGCLRDITDTQRFFSHVKKKKSGCWEWQGHLMAQGYGRCIFDGKRSYLAHRASWVIHKGDIPEGMYVCHKCDNPKCVRPEHLFLGTNEENIKDRTIKKRSNRPFGNTFAPRKLTEKNVLEIREMIKKGFTQQKIADKFGVARCTIYKIKIKQKWKRIEEDG